MNHLELISMGFHQKIKISNYISKLKNIKYLQIINDSLIDISPDITKLYNLKWLHLSKSPFLLDTNRSKPILNRMRINGCNVIHPLLNNKEEIE